MDNKLKLENLYKRLFVKLEKVDIKYSFISIKHLIDIKNEIDKLYAKGMFDECFFEERMQYFDYNIPSELPEGQTIIITAIKQPKLKVSFQLNGRKYNTIVPPTYSYLTDNMAFNVISNIIRSDNYKLIGANLPAKLLSVCGGLTKYGKNNITYIPLWGSFFRLRIFISDLPCILDHWQEFETMEECKHCKACLIKCPTHALVQDRFLIHAERCMTFMNEKSDNFPNWIKSEWNNALIGCMICQDICPLNKRNKNWIEEGENFFEEETNMLLYGVKKEKLPLKTQRKLKRLYLYDDYKVLKRNLQALIDIQNENCITSGQLSALKLKAECL